MQLTQPQLQAWVSPRGENALFKRMKGLPNLEIKNIVGERASGPQERAEAAGLEATSAWNAMQSAVEAAEQRVGARASSGSMRVSPAKWTNDNDPPWPKKPVPPARTIETIAVGVAGSSRHTDTTELVSTPSSWRQQDMQRPFVHGHRCAPTCICNLDMHVPYLYTPCIVSIRNTTHRLLLLAAACLLYHARRRAHTAEPSP